MIIGCTGNYRKEEFYSILQRVHTILGNENIEFLISSDLEKNIEFNIPGDYTIIDFLELVDKCDILFAIGGDGTILSTVRRLEQDMIPIMGIHIGGLGFLSECTEKNLTKSIDSILKNDYIVTHRMLLEVQITSENDEKQILTALNDIVIDHGPSARLLKAEVQVSDHYLNTFEGDGVADVSSVRYQSVVPGTMTGSEYDAAIRDLTNFMVYLAEPAKLVRYEMGFWVMLFMGVFIVLAYLLKKEYWRDVH